MLSFGGLIASRWYSSIARYITLMPTGYTRIITIEYTTIAEWSGT